MLFLGILFLGILITVANSCGSSNSIDSKSPSWGVREGKKEKMKCKKFVINQQTKGEQKFCAKLDNKIFQCKFLIEKIIAGGIDNCFEAK